MVRAVVVAATLVVATGACRAEAGKPAGSGRAGSGHEAHWSYQGADGPAAWGSLASEYGRCADGSLQSPIAIEYPADMPLPDLHFAYRPTVAEIRDTGHTEQVTVPPGSTLSVGGVAYRLEQLHFHAPSEHEIGRRRLPVEFHFVHRAADGAVAVVAVMAVEGRHNPAWEPIVGRLPTGTDVPLEVLDLAVLLPPGGASTRYDGSLTTPPCSEGVHWSVLDAAVELSGRQIAALTAHYRGNNRPPQPRNGRPVSHDSTSGD